MLQVISKLVKMMGLAFKRNTHNIVPLTPTLNVGHKN
jgi:hypothetical protein